MVDLKFLPSLGMTGIYKVKSPYSELILATANYTCVKIQSLAAAVAAKEDPLTNVYEANGATKDEFNADLSAGAYLVTLQSGNGNLVVFPNTALISLPVVDGKICRNIAMTISLSVIPDGTDLSQLAAKVKDLVIKDLGVKSSVYFTQVGAATVLTTEQLAALNASRRQNATDPSSALYENMLLQRRCDALQQQVDMLSDFITANQDKLS